MLLARFVGTTFHHIVCNISEVGCTLVMKVGGGEGHTISSGNLILQSKTVWLARCGLALQLGYIINAKQ